MSWAAFLNAVKVENFQKDFQTFKFSPWILVWIQAIEEFYWLFNFIEVHYWFWNSLDCLFLGQGINLPWKTVLLFLCIIYQDVLFTKRCVVATYKEWHEWSLDHLVGTCPQENNWWDCNSNCGLQLAII